MVSRKIKPEIESAAKSILLLGPRQAGKSTLVKSLKPDLEINLADEMEYLRFASDPSAFRRAIEEAEAQTVFVDEVQRLPKLLNTTQAIIDESKRNPSQKMKFYLTGSSARKLKRGGANLLPGRVYLFHLGPLVAAELDYQADTRLALEIGCLPEVYLGGAGKDAERHLKSYSATYLKEEIKAEALVQNLDSFSRFFAQMTPQVAEFVDYTKLAARAKISRHAVPRYFQILEDTLVAYRVFPYLNGEHDLDLIKHPKFYFFDNGVYNGMLNNFAASSDRVGKLSEQLVFSQLLHSAWAADKEIKISSFRTRSGAEVDFIVELDQKLYAIEVKHADQVQLDDLEGLRLFDSKMPANHGQFVFHMQRLEKKMGKVWILPWQKGLKELGL
jgi:predicted AAA+ superfamily ATPase